MAKRISKLANTLKEIGEIEVTDWDFMDLLNKDIRDLEISSSLRRLGNIRVMEWDFKDVLPKVHQVAHKDVDVAKLLRRVAHYRVIEWDFRKESHPDGQDRSDAEGENPRIGPGDPEKQEMILRLKDFLQYVAVNLVDEPSHAQIKVKEIAPNVLRFRLVLVKRDVAMLIGRGGYTAAAIRNILKAVAESGGVHALLEIYSHEEEMELEDDGAVQGQRSGNLT